ncbi:hypothetical protein ABI59_15260 [Acidobacteria bacterium Mor1]|nr:hypothetical protein ABI59_15260 [Acidobacteria bacterium Mor1]
MIRFDLTSVFTEGATSLVSLLVLILVLGALFLREMLRNVEVSRWMIAAVALLWVALAITAVYFVGRERAPGHLLSNVSTSGGPGWTYHWDFPLDGTPYECSQSLSSDTRLEGKCRGFLEDNRIAVVFYDAEDDNHCSFWGDIAQRKQIAGKYFCHKGELGIQSWEGELAE